MKQKRISFDVPEEIHTFLKVECAKSHKALRDLMTEITLKTVAEMKKEDLHQMLLQGFKESYEGKTTRLTEQDLNQWAKELDE